MSLTTGIQGIVNFWHFVEERVAGLPLRAHFSPETLFPWLGHLSIYEPVADGSDFRLRLEGSWIADVTGENWTGKLASEIDRKHRGGLLLDLQAAVAARSPQLKQMRIFQRDFIHADRALLPVATAGGDAQVLLCLYPALVDGAG